MHGEEPGASTLDAVAEEAQRALRERPRVSIRARLTVGLAIWVTVSVAITVVSIVLIGRIQAKLRIVEAVDRYTFEIQQARRFEKNWFLYQTNLADALEQAHLASDILERDSASMASVIGEQAVSAMRTRVARYQALLSRLTAPAELAQAGGIQAVEAELRVQGAEMVAEADELARKERASVATLLNMSRRIAVGFQLALLVLILVLATFIARQMLAPLNRIMLAARRIAEGDLTPITPRRRYHDEFSDLATAINYMLHELVRRQQILVHAHKLQAVGTLTAGVAHELNNPINNLMLTAAALEEEYADLDDDERKEMVADLVSESERARDIVRNLLDFARASDVELAPIDVEQLIGDTLQLASNQIKLAKVRVRGELEENVPPVYGDRRQLTQVLLNLVLNALDAMLGGGTLTITVDTSPDGSFVNIALHDTGVGIPAQNLDRIFQPFFSTKRQAKGTGLGLSVSLGIIKQHGGDIRVESEPGQGTTFMVSLPNARVPATGLGNGADADEDDEEVVPAGAGDN